MLSVSLPQKPKFSPAGDNAGKFEILGCYPGYGTTLGNALRRVLLSSLPGAAIVSVKIKGVAHEFSTIPGVIEDTVQIVLNIKKIRVKMHGEEPVKVSLKHKGEGKITAKEIKCPAGVEIVTPNQLIATITDKKTELDMEFEIKKGLGYVPVEQQEGGEKEIGVISIDAIYTPIKRVNYEVENMRVGKRTDYDRVALEIVTDGSITPQEAFQEAVKILIDQFSAISSVELLDKKEEMEESREKKEKKAEVKEIKEKIEETEVDPLKIKVSDLKNLSTRTLNVLEANKLVKIKDIVKMTEEELRNLDGMGEKGIKEIKKSIGDFGLTLKQSN